MTDFPNDPFPTMRMSVPHLPELLARLRDDAIKNGVTVLHAKKANEGEWILGMAAARLMRSKVKMAGPDAHKPVDMVEYALRIGAKIAFVGEIRREEDARAMRAGAALGVKTVGVITTEKRSEAEALLAVLGPWGGYDLALVGDTA
jgi:hypothetical protein